MRWAWNGKPGLMEGVTSQQKYLRLRYKMQTSAAMEKSQVSIDFRLQIWASRSKTCLFLRVNGCARMKYKNNMDLFSNDTKILVVSFCRINKRESTRSSLMTLLDFLWNDPRSLIELTHKSASRCISFRLFDLLSCWGEEMQVLEITKIC